MEDKPHWGGHDTIVGFVGDAATASSIDNLADDLVGRWRPLQRFDTRAVSRASYVHHTHDPFFICILVPTNFLLLSSMVVDTTALAAICNGVHLVIRRG